MTMNAKQIFQQTARRITEKLTTFEKLLADPDLAPYVSALRNGRLPRQQAPREREAQKPVAPPGIRDAIRSLKGRLPGHFSAEHVSRELQRMKFVFGARKPDKAIRNTLFKLLERREIKRVKAGVGGKSNTYTWISKK